MADRGVAGHRLHQGHGAFGWPAEERALDTPVLVAERDFQVEDLFPVALEAEMPRLDDTGVDRTNRHFVDLVPLDTVEIGDADNRGLVRLPSPRIVARPIGSMEPHRLEPRVAFRADAILLGDLPLEEMHLRAVRRHRGELL